MRLRYNYRVYPDAEQRQALAKAFGCARVVWNDCLKARRSAHAAGLPYPTSTDLSKTHITAAKRTAERSWLADVSAVVLQQALRDLDSAYAAHFAWLNGDRKGPEIGPPRFKSKKDPRQSIRLTTNAFRLNADGTVYLAKVGDVRPRCSRPLPTAPTSVTAVKDSAGRYFLSFVVDVAPEPLPDVPEQTGVDLGLTHFAVLAKSVHDAGWSGFIRMLEYKAAKHGRFFARIDRFEPTSQRCSTCGVLDGPKALRIREWTCTACGSVHDRDVNAALNILAAGRADRLNASSSAGKTGERSPARRVEAGSLASRGAGARQLSALSDETNTNAARPSAQSQKLRRAAEPGHEKAGACGALTS